MYHVDQGMEDRETARLPINLEQFRAHVPPRMRYVAYDGTVPVRALRYADAQPNPVQLPELPGWSVFAVKEIARSTVPGVE